MKQLTLMSYNIHICVPDGYRFGEYIPTREDVKKVAETILSATPDIVALQEVDNQFGSPTNSRTNYLNLAKELAGFTGYYYAFGSTIDADPLAIGSSAGYIEWGNAKRTTTNGNPHGEYGNAMLSRYPIKQVRNFDLPNQLGYENRACLNARIKIGKQLFSIYVTHLQHNSALDRVNQIQMIMKIMQQDRTNSIKILLGDMNYDPDKAKRDGTYQEEFDVIKPILAAGYIDSAASVGNPALTFSARNLFERIDYIFVPKEVKVIKSFTIPSTTSDHIPLVTVISY
ncbi:MAG: endonuclease/exonuclease/phosphatase family protein [bacterium]|nr:endonuclease/exonuclease/phosphatase family protein [bacterium]